MVEAIEDVAHFDHKFVFRCLFLIFQQQGIGVDRVIIGWSLFNP